MKIISWNVNGIRSALNKGFIEFLYKENPDIICLQETKLSSPEFKLDISGYHQYFLNAKRKGYSGTAILTKEEPISITYGINIEEHDNEGRVITAEFDDFYLVTAYVPNSQKELARLPYRQSWNAAFSEYLNTLKTKKHLVICGDLNVAHKEIDLKNPKTNTMSAGFSKEEREDFTSLLNTGFIDTFRYLHPESIKYSWWSYMFHAREKNVGWRIDYFLTDKDYIDNINESEILTDVMGSDHAPVVLILK